MRVKAYVPAVLVTLLVALITISANTKQPQSTTGVNPGDLAPGIEFLETGSNLSFQNQLGRYTLLCFWAAYDAESRARNVTLSNKVSRLNPEKIVMYSVSLDKNQAIFEETVRIDHLNRDYQFREESDFRPELHKAYKLDRGLKNYLIDDKGIIIAVNVQPEQLAALVEKS